MPKILACGCHKIDEFGNVFSLWRQTSKKGTRGIVTEKTSRWTKLKTTQSKRTGYLQFNLHGRIVRVNRLIAANFIPNPMALPEAQHKNGHRKDNRAANLKWGTPLGNALDRSKHGNTVRGVAQRAAKLNGRKVRIIRTRLACGYSLQAIADEFGVSKKLILLIKQEQLWKHIK